MNQDSFAYLQTLMWHKKVNLLGECISLPELKLPLTGQLKQQNLSSHSSKDWKSEIEVLAGLIPSEACEEEAVPCQALSFWWLAGNSWHSLACRSITKISAFISTSLHLLPVCVSMFKFPFLIRTPVIWIRAHSNDLMVSNDRISH